MNLPIDQILLDIWPLLVGLGIAAIVGLVIGHTLNAFEGKPLTKRRKTILWLVCGSGFSLIFLAALVLAIYASGIVYPA